MKTPSILAFLIVMTLAGVALATTARVLTLRELSDSSELVLIGEVEQVEPSISEGRVYTTISIKPETVWKGQVAALVKIRHLGGQTPDLTTRVEGLPDFEAGERVLVFLVRPKNQKFYVVTGLSQGKFRIEADGKLSQTLNNLKLVGAESSSSVPMTLKSFKSHVLKPSAGSSK